MSTAMPIRLFVQMSVFLCCFLIFPHYSIALPAGLVAWWPGDTNANDFSGNGYHALLMNGAQVGVSGLIGGAFHFDGINDIAITPALLSPQGTIALWVRPVILESIDGIFGTFGTANGSDRLWLNSRGPQGGLGVGPNHLVVNTGSNAVNEIVVASPLVNGVWTHLAFTFDYQSDNYALYSNGQVVGTSTASRSTPTQLFDFGGQRSDFGQSFYWNGLLDEIHIFNCVLTSGEILELYTSGRNSTGTSCDVSAPIPEPGTWLLLATGLLGLGGYGWRQRRSAPTASLADAICP